MPASSEAACDIAVIVRPDAAARPGGDTVQAAAILHFLQQAGLNTQWLATAEPTGLQARLAILFNLTTPYETWLQARALRRQGIPYLLFPVYWDLAAAVPTALHHFGQSEAMLPRPILALKRILGFAAAQPQPWRLLADLPGLLGGSRGLMREIIGNAAAVLANSGAERDHLAAMLGLVPDESWIVVGNGVDAAALPAISAMLVDQVVCIGNIGPRKNQLALARAAHQIPVPVLLAGATAPGHEAYAAAVRAAAPPHLHFLGPLDWPQAMALLGSSTCHCQPSFIETPGLATLEAAAMGCVPVAADRAPVREYVDGLAEFCHPEDPASIAEAVARARHRQIDRAAAAAAARARFDWTKALAPLLRLPAIADLRPGSPR